MAILPADPRFQSIGHGLGTGISGLLQGLAEGKVKKMHTRSTYEALKGLVGPEEAIALAALPPEVQAAYLKKFGATNRQADTEHFLEAIRSGNFPREDMQQDTFQDQPQQQFEQEVFQQPNVNPQEAIRNALLGIPQQQQATLAKGQLKLPIQQQRTQKAEEIKAPLKSKSHEYRLAQENENYENALNDPRIPAQAKALIQDRIEKNNTQLQKIREYRDKTYGKELGELRQGYQAAKDQNEELHRIEELEDEGLVSNKLASFLQGADINIPALLNPGSQEFNKIVKNNLRNVRQYFGGKITDNEITNFLETLPSLNNSPEGRKRIVANLKRLNDMKIASYQTAKQIIKNNKGIAPDDLWDEVDEKLDKQRENIAKKFKQDLKRKVPAEENRLGVLASYYGGQALKGLGKTAGNVLGGAAKGALGGATYGAFSGGGPGAAGGAGLGALAGALGLL